MQTKAAKDVRAGDWCVFGSLAFLAGEPVTDDDDGTILIPWGNGTVSAFRPTERVSIHHDD